MIFDDIVVGNYKIVEVETKEEYQLSNEEIVIEVEEAEIKEIVVENKKIKVLEEPEQIPEPEPELMPEPEPDPEPEPELIPEPELEPEPELVPAPTPIPQEPELPELPKTGGIRQNSYQSIINVLTVCIYSICLLIKKSN